MQVNSWDPLTFLIVCLGFFVLFSMFMYSKGMLWFQQSDTDGTNNWVDEYRAKDDATGNWGRRFVVPAAALFLLLSILYPVVMFALDFSSFQQSVFITIYFPSIFAVAIFFVARQVRINRHVLETRTEDSFPDASQS